MVPLSKFLKITFVFFFLANITCKAQTRDSFKNRISIGFNIIDDSFSLKNKMFNIQEEWNVVAYPSYFSYGTKASENLFFDVVLSLNKYNKGKLVDGYYIPSDRNYAALDISLKYYLNAINNNYEIIPGVEPFVSFGLGFTSIDDEIRPTLNYGVGIYFWFSSLENCDCKIYNSWADNFGVMLQTQGKSSFEQKVYGNQIQHVFALVFKY
jgi:OmpA-OmpF porin, OOP family